MKTRLVIMSCCEYAPTCVAGYIMVNKDGIAKGYIHDENSNCGKITLLAIVFVLEQLKLVNSEPCSIWIETYSEDVADVICPTYRSGKLKPEILLNTSIPNHDLWIRILSLCEEDGHQLAASFVSSQRHYELRKQASEQIEKGLEVFGLPLK